MIKKEIESFQFMVQNASNSLQIYALSFEDMGQIVGKRDLFVEILMPQLFTENLILQTNYLMWLFIWKVSEEF